MIDPQRPRKNVVTIADMCGVSVRTVYRWIEDNRVEHVRTPTGRILILADTVFRTVEETTHPA